MILILASSNSDATYDAVTNWLMDFNVAFLKLTMQDFVNGLVKIQINGTSARAVFNGVDLVKEVRVVWFRGFQMNYHPFKMERKTFNFTDLQMNEEIRQEYVDIVSSVFYLLEDKHWLPHFNAVKNNKITTLDLARKCGLEIPETKLLAAKNDVVDFMRESPSGLILKPVYFVGYYKVGKYGATAFTRNVSRAVLKALPDQFFPCLFQQKVDSEYELRVTYLDGDCFASMWYYDGKKRKADKKLNEQTAGSYYMPYKLPDEVEGKLRTLMHRLNLKTGTIDLIKSKSSYFFLEVNPCGLFLFESLKCNFFLQKKFAECLRKYC